MELTFRTAAETSLETFLAASERSPYQPQLRAYLDSLVRQGNTKADWCLVALAEDAPVARAALWSLRGREIPTDIVLIAADWGNLGPGHALLNHVHDVARSLGADALSHHVDDPPQPPQFQEDADARIRLLTTAGYELLRDGLRWRYAGSAPAPNESLVFRALPDVGEEAFVAAMASTYEGTRDSWITLSIEEHGALGAARADFAEYRGMDHRPEWWELAYLPEGDLAGVVIGAKNPSAAVVAFVGVVPEQRGRGLAAQLVRRATQQLLADGLDDIVGDCDRDNVGMVKAFERGGFAQIARRRSYRRAL